MKGKRDHINRKIRGNKRKNIYKNKKKKNKETRNTCRKQRSINFSHYVHGVLSTPGEERNITLKLKFTYSSCITLK